MSRAFIKESDGDDAPDILPDRPISPHPNLVTAEGLAKIDAEIAALTGAHHAAQVVRTSKRSPTRRAICVIGRRGARPPR